MYLEIRRSKRKNGTIKYYGILRESYRNGDSILHHELGTITDLPLEKLEQVKAIISGKPISKNNPKRIDKDSREYGASAAIMKFCKNIGIDSLLYSHSEPWRELILANIIGRIVYQGSKLSLTRICKDTALWEIIGYDFGVAPDVNNIYAAMDMLLKRKKTIDRKLVREHIANGSVVLYDITSSYIEGERCDIADFGHNRDLKKGHKQIVIGLLTTKEGCPLACEVYRGDTSDQTTVMGWVKRLKGDYGVSDLVFVGDRGMLTSSRIKEVEAAGFKTITALKHAQIKQLIKNDNIQLSMFDVSNITEVVDLENPNVRYILCKNLNTAKKETKTRLNLIEKTKNEMDKIANSKRNTTNDKIAARVGKCLNRWKVGKFFAWSVSDGKLTYTIDYGLEETESDLDGCYVIRSTMAETNKDECLGLYRAIAEVDRDFRQMKTVSLEIRPIYHRLKKRVESHAFICTLALYVQWHMKQALQPLFDKNNTGKGHEWTFDIVLERLKSIRRQNSILNESIFVTHTIPDEEQLEILNLLNVKI